MDPASVCFHALIASSTTCTSKLARPRPSTSISMADWMNQLVNAVDEAEAADALPQEEVPTEPATLLPLSLQVTMSMQSCYGTSPRT